ncbi:MAG: rod shape-determining protein MreD [Clostridia bacterium]|nr:rod shape-determining protein MreD [Clostridia bacterium]
MKGYLLFAMVIGNFILQTTIFQYFRVAGILLNTALLIVVTISTIYGRKDGVTAGILAGLLQDLFFSKAIGINILIYASIGYIIGGIEDKIFKDNYITPSLLISCSTLYYHTLYFVLMYFLRYAIIYMDILKSVVLVEMIYNLIVGIIFYRIFYRRVYFYR